MNIINPATEVVITSLEEDSPEVIRNIYQLAKEAQASWASLAVKDRIQIIFRFYELMEEEKRSP